MAVIGGLLAPGGPAVLVSVEAAEVLVGAYDPPVLLTACRILAQVAALVGFLIGATAATEVPALL